MSNKLAPISGGKFGSGSNAQLRLKKLGLVLDPPALILLYADAGGQNKRRRMPIRDLDKNSDCYQLALRLQSRHKTHLDTVNPVKIEKMIRLIQQSKRGHSLSESLDMVNKEYQINPTEDLNKLSGRELKRRKDIMDLTFKKNNIDKNHPDFVYNKEVDFSSTNRQATDWDSEVSDDDQPTPQDKNEDLPNETKEDTGKLEDNETTEPLEVEEEEEEADNISSQSNTPINSPKDKVGSLLSKPNALSLFGLQEDEDEPIKSGQDKKQTSSSTVAPPRFSVSSNSGASRVGTDSRLERGLSGLQLTLEDDEDDEDRVSGGEIGGGTDSSDFW